MDFNNVPHEFERWRYWRGSKGLGGYTTKPDGKGWFYAFYLKPSGKGARDGTASEYTYVPRLTTKRRKRKDATDRAYELAMGHKRTRPEKEAKPKQNIPGLGYCMHCKETVIMDDVYTDVTDKGRSVIKGSCPNCSTRIQKFGKVAECPECGETNEMEAQDYICKLCRGQGR